jgi:hypothetical protein
MPTTYRVTGDIFNVEDTLRFLHLDEKKFHELFSAAGLVLAAAA